MSTATLEPEAPAEASAKPETNGHAKPAQPDGLSRKAWREICRLQEERKQAKRKWKDAKEEAKDLKAEYETATERLSEYISELKQGENMPLYKKEGASTNGQHEPEADGEWRTVPIDQVLTTLKPKKLEILREAGLANLGQLEDFRAAKGEWAWDLKGIGPETRTQIEEAILNWFKEHPIPATESTPAPAVPTEEELLSTERVPAETDGVLLSVIFDDANVSEAITAAFKAKGLNTYGELQQYLEGTEPYLVNEEGAQRHRVLTDVPGITEAKAKKVEKALDKFRQKVAQEGTNGEPDRANAEASA